jgi:hypothetical protein
MGVVAETLRPNAVRAAPPRRRRRLVQAVAVLARLRLDARLASVHGGVELGLPAHTARRRALLSREPPLLQES